MIFEVKKFLLRFREMIFRLNKYVFVYLRYFVIIKKLGINYFLLIIKFIFSLFIVFLYICIVKLFLYIYY